MFCFKQKIKSFHKLSLYDAGRLFLNGTSGTQIYFDSETSVEKIYMKSKYLFNFYYMIHLPWVKNLPIDIIIWYYDVTFKLFRLSGDASTKNDFSSKLLNAQKTSTLNSTNTLSHLILRSKFRLSQLHISV